jgi:hypothetical protein
VRDAPEVNMDSSFTVKPRDSASRVVYDRTSTVRTDLSPSQSVRATDAAVAIRNGQTPADPLPRHLTIDPQAEDVIRRARDEEERRKRNKVSDEALSRMRAYRQPDAGPGPGPDPEQPHADIEV